MTENPYQSPKSPSETGVDRSTWPVMVRIGLWGLKTRGSAWAFVVLSIVLAVGSVIYGFVNPLFLPAASWSSPHCGIIWRSAGSISTAAGRKHDSSSVLFRVEDFPLGGVLNKTAVREQNLVPM
jgi:hypothetical protein